MFDWNKRVEILRAENALRDGRLDEAFQIASRDELSGFRGVQVILEKLVDPLLERSDGHLLAGRLEDALADVERAFRAGGNRPRTAELRGRIRTLLDERQQGKVLKRDMVRSAARHLAQGSLHTGKALLEGIPGHDPDAVRLEREAARRDERAREACARSEMLLGEGALLEAARAVREASGASARHEGIPPLLLKLKGAMIPAIEKAIVEGSLSMARQFAEELQLTCGESIETRRFNEILSLAAEAARRIGERDHEAAWACLGRLEPLLPGTAWIDAARGALARISEGLQALRAGPLEGLAGKRAPAAANLFGETAQAPSPRSLKAMECPGEPRGDRFLLWVDGVGSYLLVRSGRLTIGRAGSSARPDLPLAADLGGVQAEILRVDDDYFLAAHGKVQVNGRPMERKLLADGDRIGLAPRCEIIFRIPTALSTSAVVVLPEGQRIAGDAREVILMDHHILIGAEDGCHVRAAEARSRILLCAGQDGLTVKADEGISIDGSPVGREAPVRSGAQIKVGEVTFTVTPLERERS